MVVAYVFEGLRFDEICCGHRVDGRNVAPVEICRIFTKSIGARSLSSTVWFHQGFLPVPLDVCCRMIAGTSLSSIDTQATLMTLFMATLSISIPSSIMRLRWWRGLREKQQQNPFPESRKIENGDTFTAAMAAHGSAQIFKTFKV